MSDHPSVLPIVQCGHPVLRAPARPVLPDELATAEIQTLIEQMRETMRAAPGVGLAAPQVGHGLRLIVIEDDSLEKTGMSEEELSHYERRPVPFHVLINPVLEYDDDETVEFFEGCLSVNGFAALTRRHRRTRVTALDEQGREFTRDASGWYARILQHEIDHINGTLYIDRMDTRTFTTVENRLKYASK